MAWIDTIKTVSVNVHPEAQLQTVFVCIFPSLDDPNIILYQEAEPASPKAVAGSEFITIMASKSKVCGFTFAKTLVILFTQWSTE
jgi:hypothetical protein